MANVDELDAVLNFIEAHPERWDQERWCGTACCVAGHVVSRAGWLTVGGSSSSIVIYPKVSAVGRMVDSVAAEILGIDDDQAAALFSSDNTLPVLREMAAALRADPAADLPGHVAE